MPTVFEFWNASAQYFDEDGQPYLGFDYDPPDDALLSFFQVSARITEIMTDTEWLLHMNEHLYDVPNLDADEMVDLVEVIGEQAGYEFNTFDLEVAHPHQGSVTVPIGHWVDLRTGLMQGYHPFQGLVSQDQIYTSPAPAQNFHSPEIFNITINEAAPAAEPSGGGVKAFLGNAKTAVEIVQFFMDL
ncbi:MAG: hypothetical protein AAF409_19315 [Pseudomonadota bacterium]